MQPTVVREGNSYTAAAGTSAQAVANETAQDPQIISRPAGHEYALDQEEGQGDSGSAGAQTLFIRAGLDDTGVVVSAFRDTFRAIEDALEGLPIAA